MSLDGLTRGITAYSSTDEMLHTASREILEHGRRVAPRGQQTSELSPWVGTLADPRSRLTTFPSRRWDPSFCFAEWLWYMRGSNVTDEIAFWAPQYRNFSDDKKSLHGAYGHRIIKKTNSLSAALQKIREDQDTRQAVVPIFDFNDLFVRSNDIPCTLSWVFCARDGELEMTVLMRSNDDLYGLPNDVFAFTMVQEWASVHLGLKLGRYNHFANSLHVYMRDEQRIRSYSDQSFQSMASPMCEMPSDPSQLDLEIKLLQSVEESLRTGKISGDTEGAGEPRSDWFKDAFKCLMAGAAIRHDNLEAIDWRDLLEGLKSRGLWLCMTGKCQEHEASQKSSNK